MLVNNNRYDNYDSSNSNDNNSNRRFVATFAMILIAILVTLGLFLSGCASRSAPRSTSSSTEERFLSIEGDVIDYRSMKTGDQDFSGISLPEFLSESKISGTPKYIYLISSGDGFVAKIDYENSEKVSIIFSETTGWSIVAPDHPISTNAVDLDKIIVVSDDSEVGLHIIKQDGSTDIVSMGKILTSPMLYELHYEGASDIGSGKDKRTTEIYTRQMSVKLADIYDAYNDEPFAVTTKSGDKYLTDGSGRFSMNRQKINYIEETGDIYEDVQEIQLR